MSRIVNHEISEDCQPWHAPSLAVKGNANENITHYEQQEKERQKSYEKGYVEGLAKGQKEIDEQVGHLHSLLTALAMPLSNLDQQVVDELVQLSMSVVKQLVRRELKISPGEVVAVVREALSLLPAAADITLELHPEDASLIREALVHTGTESSWNIIEDPLLTRGGCRVLTSQSRIDATVEKRINSVIAEVMGGERKMDQAE